MSLPEQRDDARPSMGYMSQSRSAVDIHPKLMVMIVTVLKAFRQAVEL